MRVESSKSLTLTLAAGWRPRRAGLVSRPPGFTRGIARFESVIMLDVWSVDYSYFRYEDRDFRTGRPLSAGRQACKTAQAVSKQAL